MKICILSGFFWPVKPLYYPYNIAKILKKAGHEVTVITVNSDTYGKETERPLLDNFEGIKIIRCKNYFNFSKFSKIWFPKIKENFDIIHCCGGYRHLFSFWGFLKKRNAKYIISPFYPTHPKENLIQKIMVYLIDKTIGKYFLRSIDLCLAETENEKKWLKRFGVKKIEIIPNPILDDFFEKSKGGLKNKYKIKNKIIFCLANHIPIKNFEDLIKAMKYVENATLIIGGEETDYTKKCKELAKNIGVSKKIIWVGFMNYSQKKQAYSSCDLFVLPSKRESLGTVLLEAMAQKKPVVSTNKGGVPNIVPDKFCLYEPGNIKILSKKIKEILENKKLAKKLGDEGFKKAKQYSFSKISKKYLDIIKNLKNKT